MTSDEVRKRIQEIGVLPSVRTSETAQARFGAETVYAAGIPVAEITLTIPGALDLIEELATRFPEMVVGAGTVLEEEMARRCVDSGARFLTSPGLINEVVHFARSSDIVVLPGALTPTEIIAAWKAGADYVKVFPTTMLGGERYIRTLKISLPQVPLIVSGGVNQTTAFDFILAGASAIGVGGELLPKDALRLNQTHRIHELARRFLNLVKEARVQKSAAQA